MNARAPRQRDFAGRVHGGAEGPSVGARVPEVRRGRYPSVAARACLQGRCSRPSRVAGTSPKSADHRTPRVGPAPKGRSSGSGRRSALPSHRGRAPAVASRSGRSSVRVPYSGASASDSHRLPFAAAPTRRVARPAGFAAALGRGHISHLSRSMQGVTRIRGMGRGHGAAFLPATHACRGGGNRVGATLVSPLTRLCRGRGRHKCRPYRWSGRHGRDARPCVPTRHAAAPHRNAGAAPVRIKNKRACGDTYTAAGTPATSANAAKIVRIVVRFL